jgi:hypothetical protein
MREETGLTEIQQEGSLTREQKALEKLRGGISLAGIALKPFPL